jgi:hypothetical protein|tara:strand:- start:410 stop:655 length:246 start_codon:yes stop_codon:yes gene_type:complete
MLLRKLITELISWLKKVWFEAKLQARLDKIEKKYKIKFDKELKESFEPIFEEKPHDDPDSEAAKLGGEISLKAKWLKDSED